MDSDYIKNNFHFEILSKKHDLTNFKCESDDLNDFLKNDALRQQDLNINITQLVICDGEIIGFVSILSDVLKIKSLDNKSLKEKMKSELNVMGEKNVLPAVKIGRFAIDEKYANKGLGSCIFRNVLLNILQLSKTKLGIRFVTVEAYARAFNFYVKKNHFTYRKADIKLVKKLEDIIKKDPERIFHLQLDLKDIQLSDDELNRLGLFI